MSFQTFVTERLAAITALVNAISTNAKKIDELPVQELLNSSSKIHVSNNGISESLELQKIFDAVSNDNNQLLSVGAITLDDNDLTIASISGKINNVVQSIPTPTVINIPYCATGLNRIDLIVYNTSNNLVRIIGQETAGGIIVAPPLPLETLLVTQISVSDTTIVGVEEPVLGNIYFKKEFHRAQIYNGSGSNVVIPLNPNGYSNIYLTGTITSVDGFDFSELIANPSIAEYPHEGKPFRIHNRTAGPLTLNHEIPNPLFFQFRNTENFVLPVGESVQLVNNSYSLVDVDKSFTTTDDVTGLQAALEQKANLVDGKVPASELPSYVDDVLEFANLADFPVSGEASKIYLALDTNFTYRWTGSVYLKISDTGKLDKVSTVDVEKVYIKNADGTQSTKPTSDFGTIKGTGTTNRISKFTESGTIGDSQIFDDGTNVGIGVASPTSKLDLGTSGAFKVTDSGITEVYIENTGVRLKNIYTGGGWARGILNYEDSAGTNYFQLGGYGNGQTFGYGYLGTSYDNNALRWYPNNNVYVGGSLGIGTTSPQARLDVKSQGALATDIAFRVRNSTDTRNFLVVNGAGDVYNNGAGGVNSNTFFGEYVGRNTTGSDNSAFGLFSLTSNTTGNNNSAFGVFSLKSNTTGYNNSAFGLFSLKSNTTGYNNSAFGLDSLTSNTTGSYNSAFGRDSLTSNTTGSYNSAFGFEAGRYTNSGGNNETSNNSVYIGFNTRANANNETNQIVIGHSARGDGSNSVVLGNSSITRTRLQGQVIIGTFATPPTGIEGAIYYDSAKKKHYGFDGITWNPLY